MFELSFLKNRNKVSSTQSSATVPLLPKAPEDEFRFLEGLVLMVLAGLLLFSLWMPLGIANMDAIEDCVNDESACSYQLMNATTGERSCESATSWGFTHERTLRFWDTCQQSVADIEELQLSFEIALAMPVFLMISTPLPRKVSLYGYLLLQLASFGFIVVVDCTLMRASGDCKIVNNHPFVFGFRLALLFESLFLPMLGIAAHRWTTDNDLSSWCRKMVLVGPVTLIYSIVGLCYGGVPDHGTNCQPHGM